MDDYGPLALLNHTGQNAVQRGRIARISIRKDVYIAAFLPGDVYRSVDSFFDVLPVEIQGGHLDLFEGPRESQNIP